eukprot:GGOE01014033.1.p1 GENE.GGOE01014033.1~~GGOE01014033.1.p1  ORF type:complete len:526 (+),score=153.60 GGOE01014033.1:161-1579(+)
MTECRDELCDGIWKDLHKDAFQGYMTECTIVESEIQLFLDHLHEYMQPEAKATDLLNQPASSFVHREPLGVALIIGAYNYPVMLSLSPLVGCIAAGNCALIKMPTPLSVPTSASTMARLVKRYMDPNCFDVVEGDREAVTAVLEQRWDIIFFTGSPQLGRVVAQAAGRNLTPVLLEMGGQNPCVVDKSASLAMAARRIVWGGLINCGQSCLRPDYIFIHDAIADRFREEVQLCIRKFYSEQPQSSPWFGRLPHEEKCRAMIAVLQQDEAFLDYGGKSDVADRYVEPSVLCFPDIGAYAKSAAAKQEIFGPILPLIRYQSLDAVIAFIRKREKPLATYVFAGDRAVVNRMLDETSSGSFGVNETLMQCINLELPFGGVGGSGLGAYHGRYSFEAFSHRRAVLWKPNLSLFDVPIRYPPYSSLTMQVLRLVQWPRPAWLSRLPLQMALLALVVAVASRWPVVDKLRRVLEVLLS